MEAEIVLDMDSLKTKIQAEFFKKEVRKGALKGFL